MLPHPPRSFTLSYRSVFCQGDSPGFICQSRCLVCLRPAPAAPTPPHHGPDGPRRTGAGAPAGGAAERPRGPRSGPAAPRRGGTGPAARRDRPQGGARCSRRAAHQTQGRPEGSKGEPGRPGGAGAGGAHPRARRRSGSARPAAAPRRRSGRGGGLPRRPRDGGAPAPKGQGRGRGREPTTAPAPGGGAAAPAPAEGGPAR